MSVIEAGVAEPRRMSDAIAEFVAGLVALNPPPEEGEAASAGESGGAERRKNRAALAALRRSLGDEPGKVAEAWEACRYVDPLLPPWTRNDQEPTFYLVAGLFGWHPEHRAGKNLGGTFAELRAAVRADNQEPAGVERRFVALLDAPRDDLAVHLRHAVSLLRSHEIPLNYDRLLRDLLDWDKPERAIRRRWARSFWRRPLAPPEGTPAADTSTPNPGTRAPTEVAS